ncbi:hypothetical protein RZS08_14550, partial [Arthrospira platensis SPKY1]|nr:hypothetical protein [Arthrospira platensis SPKY1]
EKQMKILSADLERSFVTGRVSHIKTIWPDRFLEMGEGAVTKFVADTISFAKTMNIVIEYDVARYIDLIFEYDFAPDRMPDIPWMKDILSNDSLDGSAKLDDLYEQLELTSQ